MLTVRDVALELRCSVAQLIERDTLEEWKRSNEHGNEDVLIASSRVNPRRRMEKDLWA